jgi:aspartyl/glutamyl-tRNA(Asn/Gln) amidotransferase subunit A (EC 6.3.5.-)
MNAHTVMDYKKLVSVAKNVDEKFNAFNAINENLSGGRPISVKDNICVSGLECTASSRVLRGYIPPFDATVVEKLKNKGFSVLGKTNMDEFGFGSFGLNTEKQTKNPFNPEYCAGGSAQEVQ